MPKRPNKRRRRENRQYNDYLQTVNQDVDGVQHQGNGGGWDLSAALVGGAAVFFGAFQVVGGAVTNGTVTRSRFTTTSMLNKGGWSAQGGGRKDFPFEVFLYGLVIAGMLAILGFQIYKKYCEEEQNENLERVQGLAQVLFDEGRCSGNRDLIPLNDGEGNMPDLIPLNDGEGNDPDLVSLGGGEGNDPDLIPLNGGEINIPDLVLPTVGDGNFYDVIVSHGDKGGDDRKTSVRKELLSGKGDSDECFNRSILLNFVR